MELNLPAPLAALIKKKRPLHELKWKLPEERLLVQVDDAENYIALLRKHARFIDGGEYVDTIHVKEYGENVFAYFIVRVDKKTESEKLVFDGYMIQEEEKLNLEVTSAGLIEPHLEQLGYKKTFSRELTLWRFAAGIVGVTVYSIEDFGDFIEVALPQTKFVKTREATENFAFNLLKKLGIKREEVVPTDATTLQLFQEKQAPSQMESGGNEEQQPKETEPEQQPAAQSKPKPKSTGLGGKKLF